jgi:DNA (cytosine-5)-methyltransferase 1
VRKIRTLSLFTGGGGLDIGFHRTGFDVVACLEIDTPSCETLELNRGKYLGAETRIFNCDITEVKPDELNIGQVDFIIGGPPCQSFSAAGRRAGGVTGINDTRGSLFWYYCQYLKYFQPEGFLFENVKGLLQANKAKDWGIVQKSFSDIGYTLSYRVLDAADYGVPQHRERVVLVGCKNKSFLFPRPTHGPDSTDSAPYVTLRTAFDGIDDPDELVPPYGGKYGDLLPDIPPGMNYLFYTERMGHPQPRFAWRSKFSSFLYKADPDGLSKTIVAHQGRYDGPFHWKNRKLNLKELMRTQSFPDDYVFISSFVEAAKQIGNSVAPEFSNALAIAINHQLFGGEGHRKDYLLPDEKLIAGKRKGIKARETGAKTKKKKSLNQVKNQLSLPYEDHVDWPKQFNSDEIRISSPATDDTCFSRDFGIENGCLTIKVVKQGPIPHQRILCLELQFITPVGNKFETVIAELSSDTLWDITVLWDSIHHMVSMNSSYDSLHPLYGHFTEPYPQFETSVRDIGRGEDLISTWIVKLADYEYLGGLHEISELMEFDNEQNDGVHVVQKLRAARFDVRVHQTNRTIPEGWYRVCYPFTLYSEEKNYVTWAEVGSHKTADLSIIKTDDGIQPVALTQKQ